MKSIIFFIGLFLLKIQIVFSNPIDSLCNGDSLSINYYIAHGEFGGVDEGLIIYRENNELHAKYVRYTTNRHDYSISLNDAALINYYKAVKYEYVLIKENWVLDSLQVDYLKKLLFELKNFKPKKGFSNASEYYVVISKNEEFVTLDRIGEWNKFLEIKKVLNIEQQSKMF